MMDLQRADLCGPPSYEYQTAGPWFISHTRDDGNQAWIMHTFESAITRFWLFDAVRLANPVRRVVVDGFGVTIIGIDNSEPSLPKMCGTRQAMEYTLAMVQRAGSSTEDQVQILEMVETLRSMNGQPL